MKSNVRNKHSGIVLLHFSLLIYVGSSIISKVASTKTFLSFDFILLYSCVIFLLALYALLWQQVLKRIELSIAVSNKAITVVWGILFGKLFFREMITWNMLLGSAIIIAGIVLVVKK